jgi:hypothetical protein
LRPRPAADDQQRHRGAQQGDGDLGGEDDVQCPTGTRRSPPYCLLRWSFLQSFHQTLRHRAGRCVRFRALRQMRRRPGGGARAGCPRAARSGPAAAGSRPATPATAPPRTGGGQPLARLDAAPGDPGRDAAPAQRQTAARVVVPLVAMQLGRALAGSARPPSRALDRGTASTMGSSSIESWVLAADSPGRPAPAARGRRYAADRPCGQAGAVVDAGPAAVAGWWRRQQRLDRLPEPVGNEGLGGGGHGRGSCPQPNQATRTGQR